MEIVLCVGYYITGSIIALHHFDKSDLSIIQPRYLGLPYAIFHMHNEYVVSITTTIWLNQVTLDKLTGSFITNE